MLTVDLYRNVCTFANIIPKCFLGSGQGIGAEAARLFANEGAKVIVSDIDGGEYQASSQVVTS